MLLDVLILYPTSTAECFLRTATSLDFSKTGITWSLQEGCTQYIKKHDELTHLYKTKNIGNRPKEAAVIRLAS